MSQAGETFFTVIGCMDGRCQDVVSEFGRQIFGAKYSDTITEPGIVGLLTNNPSKELLAGLKQKIMISIEKHHSQGIIIDGHADCAGDPVDDQLQKKQIKQSISLIRQLINTPIPVKGVFLKRTDSGWISEEV